MDAYERIITRHIEQKDKIERSKRRQDAVWRKEKPDRQPLLLYTDTSAYFPGLCRFNNANIFDSNESMLQSELNAASRTVSAVSDAVPSVRANMGCGIFPTMFGVRQRIFEDKMP